MKKESKRNTGVSANKALEPTNEEMVVVLEDEDQARDICVKVIIIHLGFHCNE